MFSDITKSNSCCPQTNFAYPQNGVDERPGVSGIIMRKIANCLPDITSWDSWNRLKERVGYGRLRYPFQRHIPRCRTTSTSLQREPVHWQAITSDSSLVIAVDIRWTYQVKNFKIFSSKSLAVHHSKGFRVLIPLSAALLSLLCDDI